MKTLKCDRASRTSDRRKCKLIYASVKISVCSIINHQEGNSVAFSHVRDRPRNGYCPPLCPSGHSSYHLLKWSASHHQPTSQHPLCFWLWVCIPSMTWPSFSIESHSLFTQQGGNIQPRVLWPSRFWCLRTPDYDVMWSLQNASSHQSGALTYSSSAVISLLNICTPLELVCIDVWSGLLKTITAQ